MFKGREKKNKPTEPIEEELSEEVENEEVENEVAESAMEKLHSLHSRTAGRLSELQELLNESPADHKAGMMKGLMGLHKSLSTTGRGFVRLIAELIEEIESSRFDSVRTQKDKETLAALKERFTKVIGRVEPRIKSLAEQIEKAEQKLDRAA